MPVSEFSLIAREVNHWSEASWPPRLVDSSRIAGVFRDSPAVLSSGSVAGDRCCLVTRHVVKSHLPGDSTSPLPPVRPGGLSRRSSGLRDNRTDVMSLPRASHRESPPLTTSSVASSQRFGRVPCVELCLREPSPAGSRRSPTPIPVQVVTACLRQSTSFVSD